MLLQGETGWTAPPPYSAGIPSVLKGQKHALFFIVRLSGMTKCLHWNGNACLKFRKFKKNHEVLRFSENFSFPQFLFL
jgi:hypothetical protein